MYAEEDRTFVRAQLRRRLLLVAIPAALLMAVAVGVFVLCQIRHQSWGWIFACTVTIFVGVCFLFLDGVYIRPMRLYARHVEYMLTGRMRETTGILTEVADAAIDKDGVDCYAVNVNVGEKGDPQDDRLLYFDALKGRPNIQPGTRVTVLSNDKMIFEICTA